MRCTFVFLPAIATTCVLTVLYLYIVSSTVFPIAPKTNLSNGSRPTVDGKMIVKVLCIDDKAYGQTFNMILTIAVAQTMAFELAKGLDSSETTKVKVGLGPSFSNFFDAVLEPKDDILLNYIPSESGEGYTVCHYNYTSEHLFRRMFEIDWNVDTRVQNLQLLIPTKSIRENAMSYLQKLKGPSMQSADGSDYNSSIVTTVHRRNFEGKCQMFTLNRSKVICMDPQTWNRRDSLNFFSDNDLAKFCNLDYSMIQSDLRNKNNYGGNDIVLLCSDRQAPKYDKTFPHIVSIAPDISNDNEKLDKAIMVVTEAWIMTLSDIHYGNPMSTVDAVVNVWRNNPEVQKQVQQRQYPNGTYYPREMRPVECFGSD